MPEDSQLPEPRKHGLQAPFQAGRGALDIAGKLTDGALSGVRNLTTGVLEWTSRQFEGLAGIPLPPDASRGLKDAARALQEARDASGQVMQDAIEKTGEAFRNALESMHVADETARRALFENIQVASVVGDSFLGVESSQIEPAFRLHGRDASPEEIATDFQVSGLDRAILCIPGLFCDEGVYAKPPEEIPTAKEGAPPPSFHPVHESYDQQLRALGLYPIFLRFNPGRHIATNGRALLTLLGQLFASAPGLLEPLDVIAYSQGGLILRSALYYARETNYSLAPRLGRVIGISAPDGGSYIEKLGFFLALGMQYAPWQSLRALGRIANERSHAMQDLSHGIIREEDWHTDNLEARLQRGAQQRYFGELDDVNLYRIYSLAARTESEPLAWLGDGVVEARSLAFLDELTRSKGDPERRLLVLTGLSHFQALHSTACRERVRAILLES